MAWYKKTPILINLAEKTFTQNRPLFGNCLKGCKWAPDGTCIATNSDDHRIRIFNLPSNCSSQSDNESTVEEIIPDLEFKEAQIIYDYCWFPSMNSSNPATCFLLSASRDVPLHLWDAYSGKITASYSALNNVYELVSSRSIQFTSDGSRIIAGYEKFICLFDVSKPGNTGEYIYNVPNGIVSCLASGNSGIFASGSFNKFIGLYDSTSCENIATLQGHQGGVTHLLISPDGNQLYSGARKDEEILCWDLRNYGTILNVCKRGCTTNQRLYFDINFEQNFLATGNDTGKVSFFDLTLEPQREDKLLSSEVRFDAALGSCINGVGLHPTLPLIATTSGQRCMLHFDESKEDQMFDYSTSQSTEASLKLWSFR